MKSTRLLTVLILAFAALCFGTVPARAEEPAPAVQTPPPAEQKPATQTEKPAARREEVEPATLTDAKALLKTARAERDQAEADSQAAEDLLATTVAERDEAKKQLAEVQGKLTAAETARQTASARLTALTGIVAKALGLTDEQVNHLASDATIIPVAVETLAGRKAVDIAAGQGVPPVRTAPKADGAPEDIKADFEAAAAEPDPVKRAIAFQAASARLAATATAKTHGAN